MEFTTFLKRVDRQKKDNPGLRWGQCFMNMLSEYNPVIASKVTQDQYMDPSLCFDKSHVRCTVAINFVSEEWYK